MYEDIVDYDDFSERVGSENDILVRGRTKTPKGRKEMKRL